VTATRTGKQLVTPNISEMQTLVPQSGDCEEMLQVIRSGEVWVHREAPKPLTLAKLGRDDFFGHLAFLHLRQEPEFAGIYAGEGGEVETESIPVAPLREAYRGMSLTFKNIVDNVAACVSVTTELLSALTDQRSAFNKE
jgi:hypothetical protein